MGKDKCEICGKQLKYVTQIDMCRELACEFCGRVDLVNTFCPDNHYICSTCHAKGAIEVIEEICEKTEIKNPFFLADKIMKHPNFKIYGPEHHGLVPAVLLTALKNNKIKKTNGEEITFSDTKEAIKRASKIPGGWCGFYGSCGAGMGAGVFISIFTGATPSKDKERTFSIQITSRAFNKIADNLEHCCKRSVRISICEALDFLKEKFSIELDYKPGKCSFSKINDKCEGKKCPFF